MIDLWEKLKAQENPVVLYGMGDGAEKIIKVLSRYGIKISGVFASDGFVRKKIFAGFEVTDFKTAFSRFPDMTVLLCFGSELKEVIDNVKRIGKTVPLYAPDVPVYGDNLFNIEFYEKNKSRLDAVYSVLADEQSKKTFNAMINYKLSGDINYLFECETPCDEPYSSFLKLSDTESFVDLGAYRGDTVADFLSRVSSYNNIIAVEPDKKTFAKLKSATENIKNISLINACVSDKNGTVCFTGKKGRGGTKSDNGETVEAVCLDSIIKDECSFIKMDIEGEEAAAIKGGARVIGEIRPKMQIAAYHRSEDLFDIPEKVLNIRGDYNVYLRHFPCLPGWDTNFYFI